MIKVPIQSITDPQEKFFIKSFSEYMYKAELQNRPFFTEFYNLEWADTLIKKYFGPQGKSLMYYFGGYEAAERQMIGLCPYELSLEDWPIGCLKIEVRTGIGKALSHRDYLGALLGLGIERDAVGDIILKSFGAYVFIKKTLLDYVSFSLTGIGRYQNISVSEINFTELEIEPPKLQTLQLTVASMRLDVIVSAAFGLSRGQSTKLIQEHKAKCNGVSVSASFLLKEGDHVTLRGYGKIKIGTISGLTKKDKLRLVIEKYI